ncbi:MAG: sugar phosphate nucleotidyltransferase [Candidatus Peribacteraceae bacterium]|jgi:UTP--glucose-1-phosphate uridylyltransferase|nr:sugar phosphate nucleotidyltransferase [Candidatus Peribacteraceae bacterium]MDP7453974.1 sugar phosphate nucleotidyltransferase [Candidatus Peribacteraceae bacterium]MDP7645621.1 sugar phosphate nucleotidyltransferase [Candidatus Peribacteraceae bacterium]
MNLKQAILPAAGLGTRFLPWSKTVPKELLPLGNQPIIAHLVSECMDAGITDVCFVISKGKELISEYFENDPKLEAELGARGKLNCLEDLKRYDSVNFQTVYQDEQHGDGHAILQAADWVESEPVAILFGDDLFVGDEGGLTQLKKAYELMGDEGVLIALENIDRSLAPRYGIIDVGEEHESDSRLKKVNDLVEKPSPEEAPSTLGVVGRFLISKSTLDALQDISGLPCTERAKRDLVQGEIRLVDALKSQIGSVPIFGYECKGTRIDTGTPEGYRGAVEIWGE